METTTPKHEQLFLFSLDAFNASKETTPKRNQENSSSMLHRIKSKTFIKISKPRMKGISLKQVFLYSNIFLITISVKYIELTNHDP